MKHNKEDDMTEKKDFPWRRALGSQKNTLTAKNSWQNLRGDGVRRSIAVGYIPRERGIDDEQCIISSQQARFPGIAVTKDVFVVEFIINKRKNKEGKVGYLLKWQGFPLEESTWEPEEHLNCDGLLAEFERRWSKYVYGQCELYYSDIVLIRLLI
ncbi:hypothetical protein KIN20_004407 [Parelaphostrongylus tenuis]|uniref:Chromo domain-containing protein n=1 Tax=Parelaphostrongylus tenuis TaxID=148309 RepID=A0AAD5MRB4_PARTN|nr:hypothetical protein KIN20_004407 [Parelaphostrongylus tenuis]